MAQSSFPIKKAGMSGKEKWDQYKTEINQCKQYVLRSMAGWYDTQGLSMPSLWLY